MLDITAPSSRSPLRGLIQGIAAFFDALVAPSKLGQYAPYHAAVCTSGIASAILTVGYKTFLARYKVPLMHAEIAAGLPLAVADRGLAQLWKVSSISLWATPVVLLVAWAFTALICYMLYGVLGAAVPRYRTLFAIIVMLEPITIVVSWCYVAIIGAMGGLQTLRSLQHFFEVGTLAAFLPTASPHLLVVGAVEVSADRIWWCIAFGFACRLLSHEQPRDSWVVAVAYLVLVVGKSVFFAALFGGR